jgi:hypothetical protein
MNDSYVNFLAAELFATVSAMNAENQQRTLLGQSVAYDESIYFDVIAEYKNKLNEYLNKLNEAQTKQK